MRQGTEQADRIAEGDLPGARDIGHGLRGPGPHHPLIERTEAPHQAAGPASRLRAAARQEKVISELNSWPALPFARTLRTERSPVPPLR